MSSISTKPDYGIDAPGVVRNLFIAGTACLLLFRFLPNFTVGNITFLLSPMFRNTAIGCFVGGVLMLIYSKYGKFKHRERMLNMWNWRGDERVLDVGTGAGLLLIGAAKRLTTGRSTGIDLWSQVDLSANEKQRTLRNAELEGVKDRVEVLDGDATALTFPDDTFDVIISLACIHNIPTREGRDNACQQIARVLKPGGAAIISDFKNTSRYQTEFQNAGLQLSSEGGYSWSTFPPMRIIKATKNA
jgi:arsenite methyltransferase